MTGEKSFIIGWIGTTNFREVKAKTVKEAKERFADQEGVILSCHIVSKRGVCL